MNNNTLSLHAAWLVIAGLFVCAVAPPIGIVLFVFAIFAQRNFLRAVRYDRSVRIQKAQQKLLRDRILAARSLP